MIVTLLAFASLALLATLVWLLFDGIAASIAHRRLPASADFAATRRPDNRIRTCAATPAADRRYASDQGGIAARRHVVRPRCAAGPRAGDGRGWLAAGAHEMRTERGATKCGWFELGCLAACCLTALPILADEKRPSDTPFKIEDFAPKKGRYTLNTSIGYSVTDSKDVNVSMVGIPFFHGALLLPNVTLNNRRKDALQTSLGMRYAATDRLNLSLGGKADASRTLIRDIGGTRTEHASGLRSVSAGLDYRITSSFQQPYVLAFTEVALAEQSDHKTVHGRSAVLGASGHWAFDPVILSLTGTYSYLGRRGSKGKTYDPGDVFGLGVSIGMAVNPEISLRAGVTQSFRTADEIDEVRGDWTSSTSMNLGYTHRLSPALVMNVSAQAGIAGNDTAQFLVNFTWRP